MGARQRRLRQLEALVDGREPLGKRPTCNEASATLTSGHGTKTPTPEAADLRGRVGCCRPWRRLPHARDRIRADPQRLGLLDEESGLFEIATPDAHLGSQAVHDGEVDPTRSRARVREGRPGAAESVVREAQEPQAPCLEAPGPDDEVLARRQAFDGVRDRRAADGHPIAEARRKVGLDPESGRQ